MPLSLKITKVCLHLATLCFFAGGLFAAGLALLSLGSAHPNPQLQQAVVPNGMALGGVAMILGAALEFIARGLTQQKAWAIVLSALALVLFLPTVFLPLGFVGLASLIFYAREQFLQVSERVIG